MATKVKVNENEAITVNKRITRSHARAPLASLENGNVANVSAASTEKLPYQHPLTVDIDSEQAKDNETHVSLYAKDIFSYYHVRQRSFAVDAQYLSRHPELSERMRAMVVDWLVELHEYFSVNHEALYLAVKLFDCYLNARRHVRRDDIQKIAATAFFVACKFDERFYPESSELVGLARRTFTSKDIIQCEIDLLKALEFDVSSPVSYRFLRRFSRVNKGDMETLCLARYILENSLMYMSFLAYDDSKVAAASLLLAHLMQPARAADTLWSRDLAIASTYEAHDLLPLAVQLSDAVGKPIVGAHQNDVKKIKEKYSSDVFHCVAEVAKLDEALLKAKVQQIPVYLAD